MQAASMLLLMLTEQVACLLLMNPDLSITPLSE